MNRTFFALITAFLCFQLTLIGVASADETLIEDQYIVQLQPDLVDEVAEVAEVLLDNIGGGAVLHSFDTVLVGFSAQLTPVQAALLAALPEVTAIEQDRLVSMSATQSNATWGLDRIDQRNLPLDGDYDYPGSAGAGAHVYVIDTGINPDHAEFAGRIGESRNFVASNILFGGTDPDNWEDCEGHGTHVASTATGTTWGVAKLATVHAVRVLDCLGTGSGSSIIAGMEWAADHANQNGFAAVANLSLGTVNGRSSAQEQAARGMFNAGVLPIVAAGNDSTNACNTSPSAEPLAITVGATDRDDSQASYSNHGTCLDLYAPGTGITAANHSSNTGSKNLNGTSMATPHVAGAAAILLAQTPNLTPAELSQALLADTTPNKVGGASAGSPNRLLFVDSDDAGTPPPVDQAPNAAFNVTCDGLTCDLDATGSSDDNGIDSYSWAFGDNSQGAGAETSHSYGENGTYTIVLTVTDTAGQQDQASETVTVEQASGGFCPTCTLYEGTLSGSNDENIHPANGFQHNGGQINGYLFGPAGTDFDLRLQRYSCSFFFCGWNNAVSATTNSSDETISSNASAGQYRWVVESYRGAGPYQLYADPQ